MIKKILVFIVLLIIVVLGYQTLMYKRYNIKVNNLITTNDSFLTIKKVNYDGPTLVYDNIYFHNILQDYDVVLENNVEKKVLNKSNIKKEFWLEDAKSLLKEFTDNNIFQNNTYVLSQAERKKLLEDNNILTDYHLLKYLENNQDYKVKYWDNEYTMKKTYTLKLFQNSVINNSYQFLPINGSFDGYVAKTENLIICNIVDDMQIHKFYFNNMDSEYLNIMNTLTIEKNQS